MSISKYLNSPLKRIQGSHRSNLTTHLSPHQSKVRFQITPDILNFENLKFQARKSYSFSYLHM